MLETATSDQQKDAWKIHTLCVLLDGGGVVLDLEELVARSLVLLGIYCGHLCGRCCSLGRDCIVAAVWRWALGVPVRRGSWAALVVTVCAICLGEAARDLCRGA